MFEDKEECKERQKELEAKNFDTLYMTWEAHGSEDCQITPSMLRTSKTRLSYVVLHENFHIQCLKKPIKLEPNIEEAVGDCFAHQGSLIYFKKNPQMISHIKRNLNEWFEFYDFGNKYIAELEQAYEKNPLKAKSIIKKAKRDGKKLKVKSPINNAFFLRMKYYSPKVRVVFNALKDIYPWEYVQNKKLLYSRVRGL